MQFEKVSAIATEPNRDWTDRIFLTLDVDWAHDDVLLESVELLEQFDVAATWFVTHDTPILGRLRENPKFELGIHPNFNRLLLHPGTELKDVEEITRELMAIVPDAVSVRSHSMTQSSRILDVFKKVGLKVDCNHFVPWHSGVVLRPWLHYNGLLKAPYFWEDDISVIEKRTMDIRDIIAQPGLKVFDFHPIHLTLNTDDLSVFEETRPVHHSLQDLKKRRCSRGVCDFLTDLVSSVRGDW